MSETPKETVALIDRFGRNLEAYRCGQYNETQLRREFLDPFFKALGWDVDNEKGYAEAYKDVIHEDAIKVGGATKAPDYCFRVGGVRKFFVEAKKPVVNLKEDINPAFQLRRYAWSAKLPLSILTDFEEFAVYDCRFQPKHNDKPSTGRILYLTYWDYVSRWEEIASIFSKEAVMRGSFDKFAESGKGKRGTSQVDGAFLDEIERWREALARNLALRNPKLSVRDLNFTVQKTIDRLIFLRMCEDRGIEQYGQLQALLNGENVYKRLHYLYGLADDKYNSGLFHFREEKGRAEAPDKLTLRLKIDDKVLKDVIRHLYYPESPYEFSVLGADILGNVYEQFLGKVIRLTPGHRAVVEEKPEVKKAGGVYYTPSYIVDYIVKNTVGMLCEGKTPRQIAKLKILDPACGSGSFLIGAYTYLLNYHRDWYVNDGPQKHTKEIYQGPGGQWLLSTPEKKRILLNTIYGVDIDSQAVEVTKLSLLLKVLEGENEETINRQLKIWRERALPDLGYNIKCGNSLIGHDFYENKQISLLDDEERYRINAFDWNAEFPEIMQSGGFDAVIGNPPWGADFTGPELAYFREKYSEVIARMTDSYIYFIDRAIGLASDDGIVGFIIPSTLLNQVDAKPIRARLLSRSLSRLISLGQGIFGTKVLNTSTVFLTDSPATRSDFVLKDLSAVPLNERKNALGTAAVANWKQWKSLVERDSHLTFFVGDLGATRLLDRLRRDYPPFQKAVRNRIERGVSPDIVTAHVVSASEVKAKQLEKDLLRPSITGAQIKRYNGWICDQFIIYTTRETQIGKYPNAEKHLRSFKHLNSCKEVTQMRHPWWCLHRPRDSQIFSSPKFIGLTTTKRIELVYDENSSVYVTDAMYVFGLKPHIDPWACMATLHSKLFLFLYRVANQGESRVIPQVKASKLETLPFPEVQTTHAIISQLNRCCKAMLLLNREVGTTRNPNDKTRLQREINATDRQIDQLVYELYGLTEEEIKIVEEAACGN